MIFVVLGGGVAALNAATAIRERDGAARVVMISNEPYPPYSRPMLTKAALKGFLPDRYLLHPPAWYNDMNIELQLNRTVTALRADDHLVTLDSGERLRYDRCVYALGASGFVPPFPGAEKKGVIAIRTFADIRKLRAELLISRQIVVIGGGVVGLEAAWELRRAGRDVTVLEMAPNLMGRILDGETADRLRERVEGRGIAVRTAVGIDSIAGGDHVRAVRLTDGTVYPAELVVVSCGVRPAVAVAKKAGLHVERGVVVSPTMATSSPDVFAGGDCAEWNGMNNALWSEAATQGTVAGANAAGDAVTYEEPPPVVLFRGMGTNLYAVGDTGRNETVRYRVVKRVGEVGPESRFLVNDPRTSPSRLEKLFFADDRLVGAVLMDDIRAIAVLQEAVGRGEAGDRFYDG
ncbi:MAG: FAD-dependent oxidoreductase [Planctomycetaceae bacterium]|nr:FAD-dependent oxidoreductase [Planctomycetaceae bacterium]